LESVYRTAEVTANVCIYAAPDRAKPLAIVVPNENMQAEARGNIETLRARVLEELQVVGRRHCLAGFEIVESVVISEELWTPENVSIIMISQGNE
jgi:long-chain acyl-CoA synthetase